MSEIQTVPVQEARENFADLLDAAQWRGQHVQITRRGKISGVLVPPDWYDRAVQFMADTPTDPTG